MTTTRKMMTRVLGVMVALALVAGRLPAEQADFRWIGTVDSGETLEVKGVNGTVSVERADGDEAEVTATLEADRSDPAEVRIERVDHADGVTFCAVYPAPSGRRANRCAPGDDGRMNVRDNDVEVHFVIRLPADVRFSGRTVNGDVKAQDVASDLELVTVNGDVRLRTTGHARARTVNGSIDAVLGRVDGDLEFETVNGSIDLDLPDDAGADLDARWVNGGLDTSLPFTVQGRLSRTRARGTLGDGGPRLALSTVNGSIGIR